MDFNQIEMAVGQRLATTDDIPPIAWPNAAFTPAGEYVEFRHAPNTRPDPTISGGYEYQLGIFLLTAVVPAGGFTTGANALAKLIADRFPKALRLNTGEGNVVITAPSALGTPFQDGAYWRQPVRVFYITEKDTGGYMGPSHIDARQTYTGWASYVHTGAAQTLVAGVSANLANNAGTVIDAQKPMDVDTLYDGTAITGREGDSIMAAVEFTFTPADGTASTIAICIDIGGAVGQLYVEEFPIMNGALVPHKISYHPPAYTLDTWEANGGVVKVTSDGGGAITTVRYVIHRLHKAR